MLIGAITTVFFAVVAASFWTGGNTLVGGALAVLALVRLVALLRQLSALRDR